MRSARRTRIWAAAVTAAAFVLLVPGAASACDVPASAEVSCAPDLQHWQGTVTVTNVGTTTFTITAASLDTTAWSSSAALTGLAPGTAIPVGGRATARATGLPLTTSGATLTYSGRWTDGRSETWTYTLGRPVTSCQDVTTTTGATTSTTESPSSVATTSPTTMPTTATTSATTTATTMATTTVTTAGTTTTAGPEQVATTPPASVLDESVSSTPEALPSTGAGSTGQLAFGALLLVVAGVGLMAIGFSGSERAPRRHHR